MCFYATVADASSQSTGFSGEVVPGVEKTPAPDDGNNEDGSRGGKVCLRHAWLTLCRMITICCRMSYQMIIQVASEVPDLSFWLALLSTRRVQLSVRAVRRMRIPSVILGLTPLSNQRRGRKVVTMILCEM